MDTFDEVFKDLNGPGDVDDDIINSLLSADQSGYHYPHHNQRHSQYFNHHNSHQQQHRLYSTSDGSSLFHSTCSMDESLVPATDDFNLLQYAAGSDSGPGIKLEDNPGLLDEFMHQLTNPQDEMFTETDVKPPAGLTQMHMEVETIGNQPKHQSIQQQHSHIQQLLSKPPVSLNMSGGTVQAPATTASQSLHMQNQNQSIGDINVSQLTVDQLRQILMQSIPAIPGQIQPSQQAPQQAPAQTVIFTTKPAPVTVNRAPAITASLVTQTNSSHITKGITTPTNNPKVSQNIPVRVVTPPTGYVSPKAPPAKVNTTPNITPAVVSPPQQQIVAQPPSSVKASLPTVITSAANSAMLPVDAMNGNKLPITRCSKQPKPKERRSSHNVIEKRYRMSINDKIIDLKNILMGEEAKLNKSAVLKKAIEAITHLRHANSRLTQQNAVLKMSLQKYGEDPDKIITDAHISEPLTPSSSDSYSPTHTILPESPEMSNSSGGEETYGNSEFEYRSTGMVDGSRLFLCIFMFAVLVFNPFSAMFGKDGSALGSVSSDVPSRTLQGFPDNVNESLGLWNWFIPFAMLWICNLFVIALVLVKLLVYGEPVTSAGSRESTRYWRHMNQAELDLENGFYASAAVQYKEALQTLGRPIPTTRLDLFTSLGWQTLRQILHRTYIARIFCQTAAWRNKDVVKSSQNAATAYHRLLQLSLTGKVESSGWQQLNFALCSLNLAEASHSAIERDLLAQIYATAAVTILHTLTEHLHFIARFLLSRCRKHCMRSDTDSIPAHLKWLCEPAGHRYLVDLTWYDELRSLEQGFSTNRHPYDPLATLMQCYRQHLLDKALNMVTNPRTDTNIESALDYLETIESTNPHEKVDASPYATLSRVDQIAHWWSELVAVGINWSKNDNTQAEHYHHSLSCVPAEMDLESFDEDCMQIVYAVHDAYKARRGILTRTLCPHVAGKMCEKASNMLNDSVISTPSRGPHKLRKGFQILACDWLLRARTEIWQQEVDSAPGSVNAKEIATGFRNDLNNLQKLCDKNQGMSSQIAVHQATYRMMLGANPSKTSHLLKTSLHNNYNSVPNSLHYQLSGSPIGGIQQTHLLSRSDMKRQLLTEAVQSHDLATDIQ